LTNAIDNDVSTYWETNKANTATWNNEVIVTFTDVVEFNRIVFGARPDKKGFATKFEIYASPTVEGETFELLATGEQNAVTGLVEAQFDSTQMKRVKFKFVGATQNWATLSELAFYQQDHVVDAMNNLFTDETKSALNEAYMNEAVLTQLSQAVANHPFADQYTTALEDAWILQQRTPAQVEIAKTEMFTHFENEAYTSTFKMPSSNIATIKNNGGHYASRVIKNAIDDDLSTYWETNTSNKTNWKNEVEVIFHNRETLNRMVFGARPDLKGFAAKFEIYASNTTEGDTYELIATGKHNAQTGLVEAKFEAREIKRIKLKFIDSLENWATLSELAFYQVDELTEVVENDIFMDKTYVALTPAYQSHEALEALREVVEQHPASATLMPIVERAFQVLEGNATNEGLVVTAIQD
ncbi:MAG: discoidin domain-containing protein, partial [Culicoidibacterales bacterium]